MGNMNDDLCETGLVLGLGVTTTTTAEISAAAPAQRMKEKEKEPCLTLSLFGETFDPMRKKIHDHFNKVLCSDEIQSVELELDLSAASASASSLSNGSVKRERTRERDSGTGSEKVETETERDRICSRLSDEDDDEGSNNRKKLRLTKAQSALLEESFKHHTTLNPKQKQDLARELKLRPRQVEVWFQNRRARTKLKQTEVECELLKKWCETLSDENRRLHKELHHLKLVSSPPHALYLPPATLTMCPSSSCQRIGAQAAANPSLAARPRFYNPFTYPSPAC